MKLWLLALVLGVFACMPTMALQQQDPGSVGLQTATGDNSRADDQSGGKNTPAQPSSDAGPNANSDQAGADKESGEYIDPNEPLFAPGPLPTGTVSLIGGTVEGMDRVRNQLQLKVIAGKKMTLGFDERTSVFRDGQPVTYDKIKKGDRVYVDTILNDGTVFARNIRIQTQFAAADARGQIVAYDPKRGSMTVQDELSSEPVIFGVSNDTKVRNGDAPGRTLDLVPGSLVTVRFAPGRESRGVAQEVTILAQPGKSFIFAGTVTHLDLHLRTLSVANQSDNKTYDLSFDAQRTPELDRLKIGSEVLVTAVFNGKSYQAREIRIHQASTSGQQQVTP